MRNLVLVLGDQLDRHSAAFDDFDEDRDAVWMSETDEELTHVWCHKLRIAAFLSAMRHFRDDLRERGVTVHYHELTDDPQNDAGPDFASVLDVAIKEHSPEKLIVVHPGDERVRVSLIEQADASGVKLDIRTDRHFLCDIDEFQQWAKGKKTLTMETFYREMRKKHDVLMDGGDPVGDTWNYDHDNRETFPSDGPEKIKSPRSFRTDDVTDAVLKLVETRYGDHPGSLDEFDFPVTHENALALLRDFIKHRLENFGPYEDAIWSGEPFLYHSRLSFALNVHLLDPRRCLEAAVDAFEQGTAPINSVEGFVRQILGWREFIRGIYWLKMPEYAERNALDCDDVDVPQFFWDGETDMACIADTMQSITRFAYAHHIQRLMVMGLFSLQYGVHPYKFHEWHMAMYADAIDWVSLPNTLGMSQYGDGGVVGTKPYCASGNYVNKMSNYCGGCKYHYKTSHGDDACPMTTFYWDFLDRHHERFADNHRMVFQVKNIARKSDDERQAIREHADMLRKKIQNGERV